MKSAVKNKIKRNETPVSTCPVRKVLTFTSMMLKAGARCITNLPFQ